LLRLIALCLVLLGLPVASCAQAPTSASQTIWANDHARFVIQSVDRDGKLTGTYENLGSRFSCAGLVYPVTGWIDGDRITYSVLRRDPRNCTAAQAWTGYVRGGELVVQFVAVFWNGTENVIQNGTDRYGKQ
jgi:hypothetical protein